MDGDDDKHSSKQTANHGGPRTALKSNKVAAVRDGPANQQLPLAHEEILPALENGPSVASEASETLLPTKTQEASDVNNEFNFSLQIAGCLCVQGEQTL